MYLNREFVIDYINAAVKIEHYCPLMVAAYTYDRGPIPLTDGLGKEAMPGLEESSHPLNLVERCWP